jgi:sulfate adenylyltransferase subunit 1
VWFAAEPLVKGAPYWLKHGTRTVRAKVTAVRELIDVQTLAVEPATRRVDMNDIVRVTISAQQPLAVDAYADNRANGAFILIDEASHQTVAGGMVS